MPSLLDILLKMDLLSDYRVFGFVLNNTNQDSLYLGDADIFDKSFHFWIAANIYGQRKSGRRSFDDIFKYIFLNETFYSASKLIEGCFQRSNWQWVTTGSD